MKINKMETTVPQEEINQNATDRLLEKSKKLRERSKATNEKLDKLKEDSDEFQHAKEQDEQDS